MNLEYKFVSDLEAVASDALSQISKGEHLTNFLLAHELKATDFLNKQQLLDVRDQARNWASDDCPEHLFFNHGEYRKDGLKHLIKELQSKPTSNRAIYSLLNQSDISESGDNPIPSFMLFQCLLVEKTKELNCAVYFRALEVSNFLRINLEEIRQNIEEIYSAGVNFETVKLLIIAGRAHHTPTALPLEKPELDRLNSARLHKILMTEPAELAPLLREKASIQTVINYESLEQIRDGLVEFKEEIPNYKTIMLTKINEVIELCVELKSIRKQFSHSERITEKSAHIADLLNEIAKEFANE